MTSLIAEVFGYGVLALCASFFISTLLGHFLAAGKDRVERDAERRGL